jgi:5,5'-dehydrodivanillate O-demethylase oxygenase subunit
MLTKEQNERLTRVGSGTPMGNLLRRYWHPVAASLQLHEDPVKAVRLLGEDYVLFRDRKGQLGFVEARCAHRQVELKHGYVVDEGLRCPYHGWAYDVTGKCTSQPAEPEGSRLKEGIRLQAFPVREKEGLIFVYVGPQPAPLLPWWDRAASMRGFKHITVQEIPCNWLQMTENITDYSHSSWLHGHYATHVLKNMRIPADDPRWLQVRSRRDRTQKKLDWRAFKHGISSHVLLDGQTEEHEMWRNGHQHIVPHVNSLAQSGLSFTNFYVPVDDEHTFMVRREHYYFSPDVPIPHQDEDRIPYFAPPWMLTDEEGNRRMDHNNGQDNMAFVAQGRIFDRSKEHLGTTDRGLVMFRRMLEDQLRVVEGGGDPINVFRTEGALEAIELPPPLTYYYDRGRGADGSYTYGATTSQQLTQYSPHRDAIENLFMTEAKLRRDAKAKVAG